MANTIYSQGDKVEYGIKIYYVDTDTDKTNLPKRSAKMGSKCYVIEDKKWYILNGSYEWVPFVDAGGSGGSGSPFVPKGSVATVDELPTEDNAIGDLYIVQEDHSEWVWLTSTEEPDGYWEQIGSAILPSDIVEVTGQMTAAQAAEMRENLRADPKKFIINVEDVSSYPTVVSIDKTFAEIEAAIVEGKTPIAVYDIMFFEMVEYEEDDHIIFSCVYGIPYSSCAEAMRILLYASGDVHFSRQRFAEMPTVTYISGTTPTISITDNHVYQCGELTSLTISNPPATGAYSIVFTSGATATSTTIPSTILGLEDFAAEANTIYEINVLDNRAVVGSWAVSA